MSNASVSRRLTVGLIFAVVGVFAIGSGATARVLIGSAEDPPRTGKGAPAKVPAYCAQNPRNTKNEIWDKDPQVNNKLCGKNVDEKIHAGPGDWVLAQGGDDVIFAANGRPNPVWGGDGYDRAILDPDDTPYNVEKVTTRGSRGTAGTAVPVALQRLHLDYPAYAATFECQYSEDSYTGRRIRIAEEPTVRAWDVTRRVDFQEVAWSALVYKRQGEEWVLYGQTPWLWDRVYDEQVRAFPGNYWRSFTNGKQRAFFRLPIGEAGEFRVAVWIQWYATKNAPARDLLAWGGRHYGDYEDGTHRWCKFPI